MKKRIGLIFLILLFAPIVSLAQSPGTAPDIDSGIDPASAKKLESELEVLKTPPRRVADEQMTCVQINQELTKIMIGMGPEADALDRAAARAEAVSKKAQRKGGVYTREQVLQRKQMTQPAMTDLQSAAADLATANAASGGMARVGVLMALSKNKNCGHDTQGIPKEILDESGDK